MLYVTNEWLGKQGGGVSHFKEVSHELSNMGHGVYVLAPGFKRLRPRDWSVPLIFVPLLGRNLFSFVLFELTLGFSMAVAVLALRIDVVLVRASTCSWLLHKICCLLRRRYVLEVNGVADIEIENTRLPRFVKRILRWIHKGVYRSADCFICVASGIREELTRRWPEFAQRSVVINNGANEEIFVPLDQMACRNKLGLPEGKFIVGYVGQLTPWHGVDDLLEATRVLLERGRNDFVTVIVGSGPRLNVMKQKSEQMGLGHHVIFTGRVRYDKVPVYIGAFDIAAQVHNDPIVGCFGDPLKFWEYLASGRPVLLSDMSSSKTHVKPGLIGWLFQGGNVEDMVLKLEYIIEHREEGRAIGKANRQFIENGHRWKDVARQVEQVLLGTKVMEGE
jgi:glycosyltransferase involved in cell wall biosynthesis